MTSPKNNQGAKLPPADLSDLINAPEMDPALLCLDDPATLRFCGPPIIVEEKTDTHTSSTVKTGVLPLGNAIS